MLTLSIQAGGRSTRMGQDKALLPFLDKPLIQRIWERVGSLAEEVIITTNHPEAYRFLGVPIYPDIISGVGALGGFYTALTHANHRLVAIVACDLPFANHELLAVCRNRLNDSSADAVIPATEYGLEPLHAIYRRETCLPLVEAALKAGKRRMIAWHQDAEVLILPPDEIARYDPYGVTFWNVNTPAAFSQAEAKARELAQLD